ncbi:ATP-binding protein [Salinirubellus salinus]|uniref:ATP-binding protein n=1 Tax=Salinirubellus salinus TaxID=1364945 RepID=A0A9E7R4G5_9EURY|nr:ATP-binding protein [Salinirubellus salinus]UWM55686.1 ATP-binding protein [Salinirubellus salinus]
MTSRVISDYVTPSDEILVDGEITTRDLLDEVDLYNLYDDGDVPEKDADRILGITYPTRTLRTVIERTTEKLAPADPLDDGAHVIAGGYGTGKSHVGLVLYHLLNDPERGREWLAANDIDAPLPDESRVAALQMLNLDRPTGETYEQLWRPIYRELGIEDELDGTGEVPSASDIRDALDDTPTLLFIDEIERWLNASVRREFWDDNLAFLQNLMEAAGRKDTPLVTFVSLLYDDAEVQEVAERTNPFIHNLTARREEKIQFITHRLVGSRDDPKGIERVVSDYVEAYRGSELVDIDDYQGLSDRIDRYYPFHPDTLDLLMRKFTNARSSDARSLLDFLTRVFADNYDAVDLILTGDVDVNRHIDRLSALDGELLPSKYGDDRERLQNDDGSFDPHVEGLLNTVLLHSLTAAGEEGANRHQMIMGGLRPGINSHEIIQTFTNEVAGYAWHIHRLNGEFSFDVDENPAARIEKKAEDVHRKEAVHRIENLVLEELFGGRENVHVWGPINTEQQIDDNRSFKILVRLDYQRTYGKDFAEFVDGREFPNTMVVVAPDADVQSNTGIIKMAKNVVAGEQLRDDGGDVPDGFDDIHQQNHDNLRERVRDKFGNVHISTERKGEVRLVPSTLSARDGEDFYEATVRTVTPDESDISKAVREILADRAESGLEYRYLLNDFYRDVGTPTLVDKETFETTIKDLCADGVISVGGTIDSRPSSIGSNSTVIHGDFVAATPTDTDDTDEFGGADTRDAPETPTGGKVEDEGMAESDGGSTTTLGGTEVTDGPADSTDGPEVKTGDGSATEEPSTVTFPAMPPLKADNKFSLVDKLERRMGADWEVHHLTLKIEASLSDDDLGEIGLAGYSELADRTEVDEELTMDASDAPLSKRRVLDIVEDVSVPRVATLSIRLEVMKHE